MDNMRDRGCNQILSLPLRFHDISNLSLPSTVVTVAWSSSPADGFHVVEYDTFRVAVVTVFPSIDRSMMPAVNWVKSLAVRTEPGFRMPSSSVIKHVDSPVGSSL